MCNLYFFPFLNVDTILKLLVMPSLADPVELTVIPGSRTSALLQELRLSKTDSLRKGPPTWLLCVPRDLDVTEG